LGYGLVAEGLAQKYLGLEKFWPIKVEPTGLPFLSIRLPPAAAGNNILTIPVVASG
jgi:hypothetical protein